MRLKNIKKEVNLDKEQVEKVKDVFSVSENVIEGATTMVYLIKTGNSTWKDAYQKLKEAKPNLSLEELVDSVNLAKQFLMTKEDYERIRKIVKKEVSDLESTYENDFFDRL